MKDKEFLHYSWKSDDDPTVYIEDMIMNGQD